MIPFKHKERTYSLTVEQHENGYHGYFPALPGCYSWGATYDAVVKNAEDALARHLQTLPENGDSVCDGTAQRPVSLRRRILGSAVFLRTVNLHTVTTAAAMLTCTAIVLNVGPFARAPTIVPAGRESIRAALQHPTELSSSPRPIVGVASPPQSLETTAETEHSSPEPIKASLQVPSEASSDLMKRDMVVGVWSPEGGVCSARDFQRGVMPAVISADGAWAGDTFCVFRKKQQTESGWRVLAECSSPRERWTSNVRLSVSENRLVWTSQRGTETYARCAADVLMAQAR
jgi:predicted RNase H-like HicB family nuclease